MTDKSNQNVESILEILSKYDYEPLDLLRAALKQADLTGALYPLFVDGESRQTIKDFQSIVNDFDYLPIWRGGEYKTLKAAQHDGAAYSVKVPRGTDPALINSIIAACGDCYNGDREYFTITDK